MKNLKMFAIALAAFMFMVVGVHAEDYVAKVGEGDKYATLDDALTAVAEKGGKITLLANVDSYTSEIAVAKDVTITLDLDKYNLGLGVGGKFTVNGTLNVTGKGEISSSQSNAMFTVNEGGALSINGTGADGVLALTNNTLTSGLIVAKGNVSIGEYVETSVTAGVLVGLRAHGITVDINGTLDAKEIFRVTGVGALGRNDVAAVININGGKYTTTDAAFAPANGVIVNVKGGEINSAKSITVNGAKLNLSAGKLTVTGGNAIVVDGADEKTGLSISGSAVVTAENAAEAYALVLNNAKTVLELAGGELNGSSKATAAIKLGDTFLTEKDGKVEPAAFISGGSYLKAIVGDTKVGDATRDAELVIKALLAEGTTVTEDGNYKKVVNAKSDDQGNTGDGDPVTTPDDTNTNVPDVPKTNDNILVYASLGVVSALSVGFTAKRKENN